MSTTTIYSVISNAIIYAIWNYKKANRIVIVTALDSQKDKSPSSLMTYTIVSGQPGASVQHVEVPYIIMFNDARCLKELYDQEDLICNGNTIILCM